VKKFLTLIFIISIFTVTFFGYQIRTGDNLNIFIFGYPEYSKDVVVGPNGQITFSPLGRIQAVGKKAQELEEIIKNDLSKFINVTTVTVGISNYAPFNINILGNVRSSGSININKSEIKLSELIALCGGIPSSEKSSYAVIRYPNGTEQRVDITWLLRGEKGEDPYIPENSFVVIPYDHTNKINVFSDFGSKSIDYFKGVSLRYLFSEMQLKNELIDDTVTLIRDSEIIKLSFEEIISKNNFELKPSDTIIFNRHNKFVYVFSEKMSSQIFFEKSEKMSIKVLLSKINLEDEDVENIKIDNKIVNSNYILNTGDFVNITLKKREVYVFTETGSTKVSFDKHENMNLQVLITKLNINPNDIEKASVGNKILSLSDILNTGDFVNINLKKREVYVFTENGSTKVSFDKHENMNLQILITKLNIDPNDIEKASVGNRTLSLSDTLNTGDFVNITLKKREVYVFTENNSTKVSFNKHENMNLQVLITKLNIDPDDIEKASVGNLPLSLSDILFSGDFINITLKKREVYVFTETGSTKVIFDKHEKMNLQILVTKLNIDPNDIEKASVGNKTLSSTDTLNTGDFVNIIFKKRFVYAIVENSSQKINFEKYENMTASVLLTKLNINQNHVETIKTNNQAISINEKIESNSFVEITLIDNYIYAIYEEKMSKINFLPEEEMSVNILLSKLNINPDYIDYIEISGEKIEFDTSLKKGQTIKIEKLKNNVYVSGAVTTPGNYNFDITENITLSKIISLSKGITSNYSGKVHIISNIGESKTYNILPNEIHENDIIIEKNSSIIFDTEIRNIYIFGEYSQVSSYNIGDSLYNSIIKYNLTENYSVRYQTIDKSGILKGNETEKMKNIKLSGDVFIEISKIGTEEVIVYKNGETNVISSPIIRLIDVFSIAGGFSPVDKGIIDIFKNGDKIKSYNHIDVLSNPMLEIEKGSYIVITPETKYSYITILGNTAPQSLRTDVQINLVELLATAKIDWDVQESVIIYTPENEREVIKIENIENLRSKFVSPGSILFIPSLVDQVVYVFGEVTRPGIIAYNKGMTLIDAILKAGNVQNSAQLSSVYFFEDGHENAPKKLDISDLIKKTPLKSGMNPELKPGDIIFISKNSLTGVLEVMSTVGTFMQFINTSFTMYGNISSLF